MLSTLIERSLFSHRWVPKRRHSEKSAGVTTALLQRHSFEPAAPDVLSLSFQRPVKGDDYFGLISSCHVGSVISRPWRLAAALIFVRDVAIAVGDALNLVEARECVTDVSRIGQWFFALMRKRVRRFW